MKKHYETHVEDTDKLISVAGPILEYKSWYEQYRKLMEEQAQRKYGLYTPTSEGDDDFPSIPGMIARYSASGLTNEQMKENPVWVDKTGNGHDLQMKNFLWDGMSGCDGYTESFLGDKINWESEIYNSRKISVFGGDRSKVSIIHNQYHFQTYVKISGIDDNEGKVRGVYFYNMESSFTEGTICRTDGIYKIDITELNERGVVGIWAYPAKKNEDVYDYPVTIEILPLYPGALVFDGVDDYGTCDNFPILTKEKGYTVVALRQYLVEKSTAYLTANGDSISNTSFIFEGNNYKDTWNFGRATTIQASRILATQTSKQYDGVKLNIGTNTEGSNLLQVGKWSKSYSNVAIWELVFLDHDATEEELTKIKDYFVKTYPWLFPDQAWTVTGKTNEDENRATIANITGNGNDLVLSNFGFIEGSGYNKEGEYAGYLVTDGVDDAIYSSNFSMPDHWTVVGEWKMLKNSNTYELAGINKYDSFILYNYSYNNRIAVYIRSGKGTAINTDSIKAFTSTGLLYIDDFNVKEVTTADKIDLGHLLFIGYNNNVFTKLAFKNLAIYPTVLSKDDCIKAYNYLQTLKAK
jgi:hypothetical protein